MEKERWLPIENYEDYYEVSNYGNVRSLERTYVNVNIRGKRGKILKGGKDTKGYMFFSFSVESVKKKMWAHRLVYQAFVGELIEGMVINHIDHDELNNYYKNLEQITKRANSSHGNKTKKTSSEYTGVYLHKASRKWMSRININNKTIYLGHFKVEEDAARAYDAALIKYGLENKYKNFN